jgi:hypothetical protein
MRGWAQLGGDLARLMVGEFAELRVGVPAPVVVMLAVVRRVVELCRRYVLEGVRRTGSAE